MRLIRRSHPMSINRQQAPVSSIDPSPNVGSTLPIPGSSSGSSNSQSNDLGSGSSAGEQDRWVQAMPVLSEAAPGMLRDHLINQRRVLMRATLVELVAADDGLTVAMVGADATLATLVKTRRRLVTQVHAGGPTAVEGKRRAAARAALEAAASEAASVEANCDALEQQRAALRRGARNHLIQRVADIDKAIQDELADIINCRATDQGLDEWLERWRGIEVGLCDEDLLAGVRLPWEQVVVDLRSGPSRIGDRPYVGRATEPEPELASEPEPVT